MDTESTATAAITVELVSTDKIEDAPAPSTSLDKVESLHVDNEAKKLLGLGKKHLVMGDIPAAVSAFQEAASLLETHYQLGLAYGYNSQYDEAVAQLGKSIEVIEMRMVVLNKQIKEAEGSSTEYEKEIELKELLPEIREKIEDAKESQHSGNVAELALKATLVKSSTSGFTPSRGGSSVSMIAGRRTTEGPSSSNCVTDISHFVRKKRKPEDDCPQKDDAKKAKQDLEVSGSSGDAVANGNEVLENMEEEAEKQADSWATVEGTVEAGAAVETTAC
ncbi:Nuclear autoantigenic sperm protein [Heterocephalus glaber]|uniref:Nuclear autoantigenic sperm protein n=1 Tax=Heterocephalus glaber TaxID=10181 RepID=G5ARU4_HETGA|nr:Nuclear autoantigenic sperm protein [Heterocephalus glaber]